jgi:hypothetical protein
MPEITGPLGFQCLSPPGTGQTNNFLSRPSLVLGALLSFLLFLSLLFIFVKFQTAVLFDRLLWITSYLSILIPQCQRPYLSSSPTPENEFHRSPFSSVLSPCGFQVQWQR